MQIARQLTASQAVQRRTAPARSTLRIAAPRTIARAYVPYNERDEAAQTIDEEVGPTNSQMRKEACECRGTHAHRWAQPAATGAPSRALLALPATPATPAAAPAPPGPTTHHCSMGLAVSAARCGRRRRPVAGSCHAGAGPPGWHITPRPPAASHSPPPRPVPCSEEGPPDAHHRRRARLCRWVAPGGGACPWAGRQIGTHATWHAARPASRPGQPSSPARRLRLMIHGRHGPASVQRDLPRGSTSLPRAPPRPSGPPRPRACAQPPPAWQHLPPAHKAWLS